MKTRASALCLVLFVSILSSCSGPAGPTGPRFEGEAPAEAYVYEGEPGTYGGVLVTSTISDPKSFNPITSSETSTTSIINGPVYTPLLGFDNTKIEANSGLTTRHEMTPDGLVYTFYIRKGIQWSDGQPFTAHDVKFTFDVAFDEKVDNSIKSSFVQGDGSYPKVEVLDDLTVRFTFTEPNPLTIDNIGSTYLVPRHKWESTWKAGGFNEAIGIETAPADIVGLGPYRIKEFVQGQRVELERNPYFWKVDTKGQRLPYIDRVVFTIVPDMNVMLARFQAGESDMMWTVRPEEVDLLKAQEQAGNFKVHDLGPGYNYTYLAVNQNTRRNAAGKPYVDPVKSAWFTNVKFRQALSYAIDRDSIIKTLLQGRGGPVYSFIPPANTRWYDDAAVVKYPHDLERARTLLKEIGIEDRNGDGIAEDAQGNNVEFRLVTNSNNPTRVQMATLIKDNLKQVGINVNFQGLEFNSIVQSLRETWDWEAVIGGWQSANPPDPILGKNIILSSGDVHYSNPSQPEPATDWERQIDEILQLNARTLDPAQRKQQINEAVRLWSTYLPEIDLVAANYYVAAKNRVKNMRPSPLPLYTYWNIEELYLAE
jgi:peptide/nickel transport system substrate-binding protein